MSETNGENSGQNPTASPLAEPQNISPWIKAVIDRVLERVSNLERGQAGALGLADLVKIGERIVPLELSQAALTDQAAAWAAVTERMGKLAQRVEEFGESARHFLSNIDARIEAIEDKADLVGMVGALGAPAPVADPPGLGSALVMGFAAAFRAGAEGKTRQILAMHAQMGEAAHPCSGGRARHEWLASRVLALPMPEVGQ